MRIFGMYGMNCAGDLSQKVFEGIFDYYKVQDVFYQVMDIPPMALVGAIESLRQADVAEVNIAWPFQEYVTTLVDEKDALTETAFACNTIVGHDELLSAHNTNGEGFVNAVNSVEKFDPKDKQILLLGAGAIARTIAVVMVEAGAKEVMLANRTNDRAMGNAMDLAGKTGKNIKGCGWDNPALGEYLKAADMVVNCTFLGDASYPDEMPVPELLANLHSGQIVADVTVKPVETPFLKKAKSQGATVVPGYLIFMNQCLATYKLWTNEDAPKEIVEGILRQELEIN